MFVVKMTLAKKESGDAAQSGLVSPRCSIEVLELILGACVSSGDCG